MDTRQTFNPDATNAAGLNVGAQAGDPSTPSNGDLWYDSTANELTARINGVNTVLGVAGGGGAPTDATFLVDTANGTLSMRRSSWAPRRVGNLAERGQSRRSMTR